TSLRIKKLRPICRLQKLSNSDVYILEIRPESNSYRCSTISIKGMKYIGQPTIGFTIQNTKQSHKRTSNNHTNLPMIVISTVVLNTPISTG
ncbi:1618_t:CDS:1, partial [Dentiscutata heterogama]